MVCIGQTLLLRRGIRPRSHRFDVAYRAHFAARAFARSQPGGRRRADCEPGCGCRKADSRLPGSQSHDRQTSQSGFAHFTLSYVLRYAGLLHDAARECNEALRLDPGNYQFRSCASVFGTLGQFDQARAFLQLDAGSEWSTNVEAHMLLREGKTQAALEWLHRLPSSTFFHTRALEACYSKPRPPGLDQLLDQVEKDVLAFKDPEPRFSTGVQYNACRGNAFSARL